MQNKLQCTWIADLVQN